MKGGDVAVDEGVDRAALVSPRLAPAQLAVAKGASPLADDTPRALVQPLLEQPFSEEGATVHGKKPPYLHGGGCSYYDGLLAAKSSVRVAAPSHSLSHPGIRWSVCGSAHLNLFFSNDSSIKTLAF